MTLQLQKVAAPTKFTDWWNDERSALLSNMKQFTYEESIGN